jgi:hypothetical protein
MFSLFFVIIYILLFEMFHLDLTYFIAGSGMILLYRIYKKEASYLLGYLDLFTTKYTKQNMLGWLACIIFYGYYFWRTNQIVDFETFLAYPTFVIWDYFIRFQDGTKGTFKLRK